MKKNIFYIIVSLFISSSAVFSEPVQWTREEGGNGHYYDIVEVRSSAFPDFFLADATAAESSMEDPVTGAVVRGYSAAIDSQEEQSFIQSRVLPGFNPELRSNYDYAWLGLSRAAFLTGETQGRFFWVTDPDDPRRIANYFNWAGGEPRAGEDYGMMVLSGNDRGKWVSGSFFPPDNKTIAVLVEYNTNFTPSVVPVPPTVYSMALGLGGLLLMARKRKRAQKSVA